MMISPIFDLNWHKDTYHVYGVVGLSYEDFYIDDSDKWFSDLPVAIEYAREISKLEKYKVVKIKFHQESSGEIANWEEE